jgi:hypothetical protein
MKIHVGTASALTTRELRLSRGVKPAAEHRHSWAKVVRSRRIYA